MRHEPQPAKYTPAPQIEEVADFLADPVVAAEFPQHTLRFRNRRWDKAVGLHHLSDEDWVCHFGQFAHLPDNLPQPLALRLSLIHI